MERARRLRSLDARCVSLKLLTLSQFGLSISEKIIRPIFYRASGDPSGSPRRTGMKAGSLFEFKLARL